MKTVYIFILTVLLTSSCGIDKHGVVGANFSLREESPLPSWLSLPKYLSRKNVVIKINRYEATVGDKWKVRVIAYTDSGQVIADKAGYSYWHPASAKEERPAGTFPNWIVFEIDGTTEIYEQREFNNLLEIVKKPLE